MTYTSYIYDRGIETQAPNELSPDMICNIDPQRLVVRGNTWR